MPEHKHHIKTLLEKYFSETATDAELRELFAAIESYSDHKELEEIFLSVFERTAPDPSYNPEEWESVLNNILQTGKLVQMPVRKPIWKQWWAAASILLVVALTTFLAWPTSKDELLPPSQAITAADILPAREGALLTLADGSQILLDTVKNGKLLLPGSVEAIIQDGQITYSGNSESATYNLISTPNGRQYKVVLPDGSLVWMNTASTLRYPTRFNDTERRVELSGEAYFEVVKDAGGKPFYVSVNDQSEIEVLGTKFNVNAYNDEQHLRATLLQGKVRVKATVVNDGNRKPAPQAVLSPGQQAIIEINKSKGTLEPVLSIEEYANIDQVMAWKNGMFYFDGMSLMQVARQLERWYDIKVEIQKSMQDLKFGGSISNKISLQQLLEELEFMGIRTKLEDDRRLIVLP